MLELGTALDAAESAAETSADALAAAQTELVNTTTAAEASADALAAAQTELVNTTAAAEAATAELDAAKLTVGLHALKIKRRCIGFRGLSALTERRANTVILPRVACAVCSLLHDARSRPASCRSCCWTSPGCVGPWPVACHVTGCHLTQDTRVQSCV